LLVTMLTTAGAARRAACAKPAPDALPAALSATGCTWPPLGSIGTTAASGRDGASQSGRKVATTNNMASATVTACEKMSQILRMNTTTRTPGGKP
jgi:hypothetical protein